MKRLLLVLSIFCLLTSCLVQGPENKRRASSFSINNKDNGNETTKSPDFTLMGNVAWFGTELKGLNITVNGDNDSYISLRGRQIHNFLKKNNSEFERSYCIVFHRFNDLKAAKQLRLRALPNSIIDFANQTTEFAFRIELQNEAGSKEICGGTLLDRTADGNAGTVSYTSGASSNANVAFSLNKLCFNDDCVSTDLINSNAITIYESIQNTVSDEDIVIQSVINTGLLAIKVGYSTSIDNNASFCSVDNDCQNKDFDCCNDNQCVNDGTLRSDVDTESAEYFQAKEDIKWIPERYKAWPNIYNVCEMP